MKLAPKPIITIEELLTIYKDQNVIIADVSNSPDAYDNYLQAHLENAVFVDVNKDLAAAANPSSGGRHPLPELSAFLEFISRLGIVEDSRVILYDHHFGANAAARFLWMLKAVGLENVQVLDGGFNTAVEHQFPLSTTVPKPRQSKALTVAEWLLPQVFLADVRNAVEDKNSLIIDVRDESRYKGEYEPIDPKAGHIPGAVNIPYKLNLDETGNFKKADELAEMYRQKLGESADKNIIVHCGSGVTACHTLLAFELAGLKIPALYVGSWSEWSA